MRTTWAAQTRLCLARFASSSRPPCSAPSSAPRCATSASSRRASRSAPGRPEVRRWWAVMCSADLTGRARRRMADGWSCSTACGGAGGDGRLPAAGSRAGPPPLLRAPSPLPPAGYLTQSIGMLTADASRGAFLSGFTVVVVPLMAGLCGTAKLKRTTWAAVGAALAGISLLEDSGAPASWGDFWSFASAVLFGAQVGWAAWAAACLLLALRPPPPSPSAARAACCMPPLDHNALMAFSLFPCPAARRSTAPSTGPSSWAAAPRCPCSPCRSS